MEKNHLKGFLTFLILAVLLAFSLGSQAQQKQISGQVVDQNGVGVPGVTIIVKETTVGTVSDVDGK